MAESWKKSPPELVAAFATCVQGRPELATRQMFGYPAAFLGGNLATSLYQDRWILRLADADAAVLRDLGGQSFEPMPGRAMRGYVSLPAIGDRRPGEPRRVGRPGDRPRPDPGSEVTRRVIGRPGRHRPDRGRPGPDPRGWAGQGRARRGRAPWVLQRPRAAR